MVPFKINRAGKLWLFVASKQLCERAVLWSVGFFVRNAISSKSRNEPKTNAKGQKEANSGPFDHEPRQIASTDLKEITFLRCTRVGSVVTRCSAQRKVRFCCPEKTTHYYFTSKTYPKDSAWWPLLKSKFGTEGSDWSKIRGVVNRDWFAFNGSEIVNTRQVWLVTFDQVQICVIARMYRNGKMYIHRPNCVEKQGQKREICRSHLWIENSCKHSEDPIHAFCFIRTSKFRLRLGKR